jgi:hypothetical protein
VILDLIAPLVFGLVGSGHCLGMCGPLVLAYSLHHRPGAASWSSSVWPGSALHHLAFHAGRLLTYGLLGALGAAVTRTADVHRFFTGLRSAVALGGGALMVLFGLGLLGVMGRRFPGSPGLAEGPLTARLLPRLFSSKALSARLALGFASGFLPCMLSLAMIVKAATTGSPVLGFLTMLSFGLGTLPVLFATGLSASLLSFRARLLGERLAGVMVIIMGLIVILKARPLP